MSTIFRTHAERLAAFERCSIYPVVSSEFCAGRPVPEVVRALAQGGAGIVQMREKHLPGHAKWALARELRAITREAGMLLLIDDDLGLAIACGADGVHLGQDDLPAAAARSAAPDLLLGASTHNPDEIAAAQADGFSYLNIGPVFPTQTKDVPQPVVGLDHLREWLPLSRIPTTVMGGIKPHHIPALRALGCRHLAMVTALTQAPDIAAACRECIALATA